MSSLDADDFNRIMRALDDMAYISTQVLQDVIDEITHEIENRTVVVDKSTDPEDEESRQSIAIRENWVIDSQEDKRI